MLPADHHHWLHRPAARATLQVLLTALLVAGTWLALVPRPPAAIDTGWDKANHLLAFAALAAVAALAFPGARRRDTVCAAGLLAYGAAIEGLQALLPWRSAEWLDLLADAIGIVAGLLIARFAAR